MKTHSACCVFFMVGMLWQGGEAHGQTNHRAPAEERGRANAERLSTLDGNNIRTFYHNFGMIGDYPPDPLNVDLGTFHSVEIPRGSGMNYVDGITPFILAKIRQRDGSTAYVMETGYRERQALSPYHNYIMRFEPRPGFFQTDTLSNPSRSFALSNRPETWPQLWPDKMNDSTDPGWGGSWNGYFGKNVFRADQESYAVMDDNFYDAWDFYPDPGDTTRRGLALRLGVRSLQWSAAPLSNTIFWHYDILNEGTTDYTEGLIFGFYVDAGIGATAVSCDGIAESDDDRATWERQPGSNLTYMWDHFGHGNQLNSNCGPTGYAGFSFLQTPGNSFNAVDDDMDGMTDECQDSGPGTLIVGQAAILAAAATRYDTTRFSQAFGTISFRPAVLAGMWWTGDEDLDWAAPADDVGADGIPGTYDQGEGDGIPTQGEPHFDVRDPDESDQTGLSGFKMIYISNGIDDIRFFMHPPQYWPQRLYEMWTDSNLASHFDPRTGAVNINIAYLLASGPFSLDAGRSTQFDLALTYGGSLDELRESAGLARLFHASGYTVIPTGVKGRNSSTTPPSAQLFDCYPNPFNPRTIISYQLPAQSHVTLKVYDMLGREVRTLADGMEEPGHKSAAFDARDVASGIYFYRLQAGGFTQTKKLILLK